MGKFERQGDLFSNKDIVYSSQNDKNELDIDKRFIKEWQNKIIKYQVKIFSNMNKEIMQSSLFKPNSQKNYKIFNPLDLTPLSLSFWRWPKSPHEGPAVYFVIDKAMNAEENIILYIGETVSADKRWKGNHDCKGYLSNYCDSLQKAGLKPSLNIRFWIDVPNETKARRKLEQELIQTWLPPFNKETRGYWSTPFTSEI